jgi:NAD-dependent deacetylase sirtuin 4
LNKSYRPIYYHEFLSLHEFRKRYWARSFIGFASGKKAKPNDVHRAIKRLGELGILNSVVTQSKHDIAPSVRLQAIGTKTTNVDVDSFHQIHPDLPTTELHGFLRSNICLSCHTLHDRKEFQQKLAALNPEWADLLAEIAATGALDTEDPAIRRAKGLRTNPDGDVDLPNVSYSEFRYPPCPKCLTDPPILSDGEQGVVLIDEDGAWKEGSTAGVLKPAVVMFGEAIRQEVKHSAEESIDNADRLLVIGSSLATYSAWRLAKRARDQGKSLGILNLGGTRGEEAFFQDIDQESAREGLRCNMDAQQVLPALVDTLEKS